MPSGIYIKSDGITPALHDWATGLVNPRNIMSVSGVVKSVIVSRTLSGVSSKGTKFPDYSAGYKRWKTGQGYPATPNLSLTGEMMGDIQINIISPTFAVLFFGSRLSAAKAHKHHTGKFPFFDVQKKEYANLYAALLANIKRLKGYGEV